MSYWDIPEPPLEPPEDRIACYCGHCGGEIYEGGEFYRIDNQIIAADCLGEFAEEYFADCLCDDGETYFIDGKYIEDTDLERFARSYFAGDREEAEVSSRTYFWRRF